MASNLISFYTDQFFFFFFDHVIRKVVYAIFYIFFSKYITNYLINIKFHFNFYTHITIYRYSSFDLNYIFHHQTFIHICMVYFFLMSLVHFFSMMLKTSTFKCYALSGTHADRSVSDSSLWALQFPTHPLKLIPNEQ